MRSHFVVVLAPGFDLLAGVFEAKEPVLSETFHAGDGVEALGVCVFRRLPRPAEVQYDAFDGPTTGQNYAAACTVRNLVTPLAAAKKSSGATKILAMPKCRTCQPTVRHQRSSDRLG